MLPEPSSTLPATERRSALWPWFAMPAAALALFYALHHVRYSTDLPTPAGQSAGASQAGEE